MGGEKEEHEVKKADGLGVRMDAARQRNSIVSYTGDDMSDGPRMPTPILIISSRMAFS
jgi:hypothetical protein